MPASTDYQANRTLSNFAVQFRNYDYVADQVSPVFEVDARSAFYYEFGQSDNFDEYELEASDEGFITESKSRRTQKSYTTVDFSHAEFIPRLVQEEGDLLGFPEIDLITQRVTDVVLRKREIFVAARAFAAANYSGMTAAAAATWQTATVAQITNDINTGVDLMVGKGNDKLKMVMGIAAFRKLSTNANLIANVSPTKAVGQLTKEVLAELLQVDEIVVGAAKKNTAKPAADSPTKTNIWGNFALLAILTDKPGLMSTGHNVSFRRKVGGLPISTYLIPTARGAHNGTLVKVSMTERPMQFINNQAGYLISGI